MKKRTIKLMAAGLMGLALQGAASAANVNVSSDIATSTTWTSDNVYNLTQQVYVLPGASLTIEAGTLVQSTPTVDGAGSLAVCNGAQIFVLGTKESPVIMTSSNDDLTNWREACNEWGNLTVMGDALISASHYGGNPVVVDGRANAKIPDGLSQKQMEGLTAEAGSESNVLYGGANDDYDAGTIQFLSVRYGGRVVGLANELNGLSLGGIGRETDIHHIEIMNNVDDGIEIWGGTVNLKYFSIWNIGDDSFDVDQGWRGKAQFGLIVQGYSIDASQGSGVGDNCFETDGAEDSDAQPVTTAVIYNCTAIGQPIDGDGATTWRDNARVQYRNCLFMDIGEEFVRFDGDDGDGASGYGFNGTLSWADTWTTPAGTHSTVNAAPGTNPGDFNHPDTLYQSQVDGMLAEITDSIFFGGGADSGDQVIAVGVLNGSIGALESNPAKNNVYSDDYINNLPIASYTRAAPVTRGGKTMVRVTSLDPRARNDAATSAGTAPADGFFTPAPYRGAFGPTVNWLEGWTAASQFGMTTTNTNPDDPQVTINMTASTFFQTQAGTVYTVEQSSDMKNWSPIGTVVGDGTIKAVTDLAGFDSSKFYRVISQ